MERFLGRGVREHLRRYFYILLFASVASPGISRDLADSEALQAPDAYALIAGVIDNTRGVSSYAEMSMTIHRPDWERRSTLQAWTRGRDEALIRFTAPARDAGNATLKNQENMWTYTPKLNRVIRLPYSLMSQGWAGSDFSYNDLSRTDALLHDYDLVLLDINETENHIVYTIEATPHDTAPVVWGKELIVFRSDNVLLEQVYFDQDMQPLKKLIGSDIRDMGGRVFATRMRMVKLGEPDRWTEINYTQAEFDIEIDAGLFTVFSLKSGRAR